MKKTKRHIAVVFGTRPEVVKLAPLIHELKKQRIVSLSLISTDQHTHLVTETLRSFDLRADTHLGIIKPHQSLSDVLANAVSSLDHEYERQKPNATIVLGDTASTLAGALVSFYHKVPVIHVEAGLRTGKIMEPFPEEANRRFISVIARWHFTSTKRATDNLLAEGIPKDSIYSVGSTEPDAVGWILKNKSGRRNPQMAGLFQTRRRIVLITVHRRESWGVPIEEILKAVNLLAKRYTDLSFVWVTHPNQSLRVTKQNSNVHILSAIPANIFVHMVNRADLLMTDSGGIQIAAGYLRKPTLILRNVTEWTELVVSGIGQLVGTDREAIIHGFETWHTLKWPEKIPTQSVYPRGASEKIANIIKTII